MKSRILVYLLAFLLSLFAGSAWAATEGNANTFYGTGAGTLTTGDDDYDTFIGAYAGSANTSGTANTFLGFQAGNTNTTGNFNTFAGAYAGQANNSGVSNTFVGVYAGYSSTGLRNTCLGYQAGYSSNTGNENTFIGYQAGRNNSAGGTNTFVGSQTGYGNDAGEQNTFVGYMAGYGNTSGGYNTFLGTYAGFVNQTAFNNTFIGYRAGFMNNTGGSNTFLGYQAGRSNTAGSYNTFLGNDAGYSATGSGNVFIGYQTGYNDTGSNKLYIANSDTASPLIYGDFSSPSLTINGNFNVINPSGFNRFSDNLTDATQKVARITLNHYTNSEEPIYLFGGTSLTSATYAHFGGGSTLGNAVTQMDFWTAANTTTLTGTSRLTIKSNGYVGIGTRTPSHFLHLAGGAYSDGGSWVNASSREYKDDIETLAAQEALDTLRELNPVKFAYKTDRTEKHVGFIAEDVPELIATKDRKGLSSMDIVAVLTKVVQEQQGVIQEQQRAFGEQEKTMQELYAQMKKLKSELPTR